METKLTKPEFIKIMARLSYLECREKEYDEMVEALIKSRHNEDNLLKQLREVNHELAQYKQHEVYLYDELSKSRHEIEMLCEELSQTALSLGHTRRMLNLFC